MITITMPEWYEDAVCASVGGETWYPEKGGSGKAAKKICSTCPVSSLCLQYALENGERFGVWGGMSDRERRKLGSRIRCRNCDGLVPVDAHSTERYCGEECRETARREKQEASDKPYGCIQCGIPSTALRCQVCSKRHEADVVMTRAQTKAAA